MDVAANFRRLMENVQQGEPGHRFQDRYNRAVRDRGRTSPWRRVLKVAAGIVAIAIGLVEVVFPGPAIVFIAIGGALLASESRTIARAMDGCEVMLRRVYRWARRAWKKASMFERSLVIGIAVIGALASAFVAYRLIAS